MIYSAEVQHMCPVAKGAYHGPAPIPEEGKWVQAKEIKDISGLTHGIGWCAPQQGACKLTLNVKDGIIEEALVETHRLLRHDALRGHGGRDPASARPFSKRSTPTSCATRSTPPCASCSSRSSTAAARPRSPRAACPSALGLEDLGKGLRAPGRHHVRHQGEGPALSARWPRATSPAVALDEDDQIIGYEFVKTRQDDGRHQEGHGRQRSL